MVTDNILSAAALAALRERVADPRNSARLLGDVLALLAHLDALQAPAPATALRKLCRDLRWQADGDKPHVEETVAIEMYQHGHAAAMASLQSPTPDDGGEALGHRLYSILYPHVERTSPEGWRAMMGDGRERYVEAALALDAHGYARGLAAGRSEGEAERAALMARANEIPGLTAELDAARWEVAVARGEERETVQALAEIARLTAELADEDIPGCHEALTVAGVSPGSLIERIHDVVEEHEAEVAAARLDGALEEREALIADAAARGFHATANFIRTRARTEGRQGS